MKDKWQKNGDYYNGNAEIFFENTVHADVSDLYNMFLPFLPQGGHVLDFGCGSGRDSLYFLEHGYRVTAIDGSEKLCELAEQLICQPVRHQDFFDFDDDECYDGIWACASLLHIPEKHLPEMIEKLWRALRPGGICYASFKYGLGERVHQERVFTDMNEKSVQALLNPEKGFEILKLWQTSDVREGREDEKWLNVVGRKVGSICLKLPARKCMQTGTNNAGLSRKLCYT